MIFIPKINKYTNMKNQKVPIINGSPRKNGNCSCLIQTLTKGVNEIFFNHI